MQPCGNATITVPVTNPGAVDGTEVVQLYARLPPQDLFGPDGLPVVPHWKRLVGYAKVFLAAGACGDAVVTVTADDLALYDDVMQLRGVPGTIGGALKMNAGCYGREIKDIFVEATAIDGQGNKVTLTAADMAFEYRKARGAGDDLVFVEAVFEGTADEPAAIKARMEDLSANREASQPIKSKTGGSTFKNPPGHKAWQLIDDAGCRGFQLGGAQVSEKHTNFLINTGDATAAELEALGEEVRKRVKEKSGITLEWEIKRVGLLEGRGA